MNGLPVHTRHMDIDKLKKFKETIDAVNAINGNHSAPHYLFIKRGKVVNSGYLTFSNLYDFDYIIAIGETTWKNLGYTNFTSLVLGKVDHNFMPVDKIRLKNKFSITGISFTHYIGTWNTHKPILVVEAPDGTLSEIELEDDEKDMFKTLFEKANALKFTPKPAEE